MPSLDLERRILKEMGVCRVAGLDEAGRGALAGPVVAAAVILPLGDDVRLDALRGVNDSKQLTPKQRERFYDVIVANVLAYGVGSTPAGEIDRMGIIPANARAMQEALSQLDPAGEFLLIDGRMRLRNVPLPQQSVVRGDSLSLSIAAASILAKVTRDRHMIEQDAHFPRYGFAQHKGYCTRRHEAALAAHGPCPIHRHSFSPIRKPLL